MSLKGKNGQVLGTSLLKSTRDKLHQTQGIPETRIAGSGKGVRLSPIYTLILVLRSSLRATDRSRILGKIHAENLSPLLSRIQWVRKTGFTRAT